MRLGPLGPEFDAFVRSCSDDLLRLATLLTRDRGEAEDLLQVALVRTAGRWRAARRDPAAYARRTIVNLAKNRWRDRARRPFELRDDIEDYPVERSGADHVVERDAVSRLIAQLPMGQRTVLVLRFFADLSVAEVAAVLDCSEGNVKSQSHRALATLRESIAAPEPLPTEARRD